MLECLDELLRRRAIARLRGKCPLEPFDARLRQPLEVGSAHRGEVVDRAESPFAEGREAGRGVGEHCGPGPPVGSGVDVVVADHLGGKVGDRAHHEPRRGHAGLFGGLGDAEVDNDRIDWIDVEVEVRAVPGAKHDVAWFEVAVHDPLLVNVKKGLAERQADFAYASSMTFWNVGPEMYSVTRKATSRSNSASSTRETFG